MIKGCLFDLDGTILDTLTTIAHFGNKALEDNGIEPIESVEYKNFIGNGAKKLVERMLRFRNAYSIENFHNIYNCYMKLYDANPTYLTEPFDGIEEMLLSLKNRGIKIGVISNKPDYATRAVCKAKFKEGILDKVQGQLDTVPVKPDTKGPLMVLDALGVKCEDTVYIGDSGVDMKTGKNLGAYTVGVSWGFRDTDELVECGADKIVYSPREIADILDTL